MAKGLVVETRAHSSEYKGLDVRGLPACSSGTCEVLTTKLNTKKIVDKLNACFNEGLIKLEAEESTNAGRYLCEYIYYSSLKQRADRTLFIHVPELILFSAQEISNAIKCAIRAAIETLDEANNCQEEYAHSTRDGTN